MGIAGSGAAGVFAAGGAADLTFVDMETKAFIGSTAQVNASKDVQVLATGTEDVLAIAGGASRIRRRHLGLVAGDLGPQR